ncbi:histone H2B.2 [Striga asiatica]|uniref:Histone H2B.2 n=1 Tax=Striga asiatica TaxID=4170 RepID=A0A5A7Q9S2_STRAF|nr:histone H2B.2 [Striga asiatica]
MDYSCTQESGRSSSSQIARRRTWNPREESFLIDILKDMVDPHINDWAEIFGKDRATGENSESFQDAANDVPEHVMQDQVDSDNEDVPSQQNQSDGSPGLRMSSTSGTESGSGNRAETYSNCMCIIAKLLFLFYCCDNKQGMDNMDVDGDGPHFFKAVQFHTLYTMVRYAHGFNYLVPLSSCVTYCFCIPASDTPPLPWCGAATTVQYRDRKYEATLDMVNNCPTLTDG